MRATITALIALLAAGCIEDRFLSLSECPDGTFCFGGRKCVLNLTNDGFMCALKTCGNNRVDPGEECDDGEFNNNAPNFCRLNCKAPFCGDGIHDSPDEPCDEGLEVDEPNRCRPDCVLPFCGDGIFDNLSEECDDGNDDFTDFCAERCLLNLCGDGYLYAGVEGCDDGNLDNNDACPSSDASPFGTCEPARCGDGHRWVTGAPVIERCDCGEDPFELPLGCSTINSDTEPDACRTDCDEARCGDGVVDTGELCDDGNAASGDGCSALCDSDETCGNGIADLLEACDGSDHKNLVCQGLGFSGGTLACTPACTLDTSGCVP